MSSPAVAETIAEKVLQLRDGINLLDGGINVVLDAAVADGVAVEQDVAGAPVAVARLTDRADVAQRLAAVEFVAVVDLIGAAELVEIVRHLLNEDAGNVRMALEAVALDQREDAF